MLDSKLRFSIDLIVIADQYKVIESVLFSIEKSKWKTYRILKKKLQVIKENLQVSLLEISAEVC